VIQASRIPPPDIPWNERVATSASYVPLKERIMFIRAIAGLSWE
jgi:hypothetical protein